MSFKNFSRRAKQKRMEQIGEAFFSKVDGANRSTSKKVGEVTEEVEGRVGKVLHQLGSDVSYLMDGPGQKVQEVVGGATRTVNGAIGAVRQEAEFIQHQTLLASSTISAATSHLESGLARLTETPIGTQVGTTAGGAMFNGIIILMPGDGACLDLFKGIKDLLKLIRIFKDLLDKLKLASIVPGLDKLVKAASKLGNFSVACIDVSTAASAGIALPVPAPTTPPIIGWDLQPERPAQQGPD